MENWYFWVLLTFIFCRVVRTVFQVCYVCRRGGAILWLNCQFSRKEMFINVHAARFCQFKCWGYCFSSLNNGKSCKILLVILMQMLTNSQWEIKCNLLCLLNLDIDIGTRYIPDMKTCSLYHWNHNRSKSENKCSSLQ